MAFKVLTLETLQGGALIPELNQLLAEAAVKINQHHASFSHRVKGGSVGVRLGVNVIYVNTKGMDESSWFVQIDSKVVDPKKPKSVRQAYFEDDGRLIVDASPPPAPPDKQLRLFSDEMVSAQFEQPQLEAMVVEKKETVPSNVDPDTGEIDMDMPAEQ